MRINGSGCLVFILIMLTACGERRNVEKVWLDELPVGEVLDPYGPPHLQESFSGRPLNIYGEVFDRGVGVHAPSRLQVDLKGNGHRFEAWIGIDSSTAYYHTPEGIDELRKGERPVYLADYVYDNHTDHDDFTKGGTAIFRVLLDGAEVYRSEPMHWDTPPEKISVPLNDARKMVLVVENAGDGNFGDFANWAGAVLKMSGEGREKPVISHHCDMVITSHHGYHPSGYKVCYRHGEKPAPFEVIDEETGSVVYRGRLEPANGNLGSYLRGTFTELDKPGKYRVQSGDRQSFVFRIDSSVYRDAIRKHLHYISQQRSGHPTEGWNPAQHLDDGIRDSGGGYRDVRGGWYDACDVRKPLGGNAMILHALAKLALTSPSYLSMEELEEEMRWGNRFLLSMQEREGYVMRSLGFEEYMVEDNRWTDNVIMSGDERRIQTEPAEMAAQYYFILAQLAVARHFEGEDFAYASHCKTAAKVCYDWSITREPESVAEHALRIQASSIFYQLTGDPLYRDHAVNDLEGILQQKAVDKETGTVLIGMKRRGSRTSLKSAWLISALTAFTRTFEDHPLAAKAEQTIRDWTYRHYVRFQELNAFRVMPFFVSEKEMASGKQIGSFYYRNYLHVGMNRSITTKGADLMEAFRLNQDTSLVWYAQQQLDWVYGANPFHASTVFGIGHRQPTLFRAGDDAFEPPHTPVIEGGVMTGIGADPFDKPALFPGWWWTTEYWMPTNAGVLKLVTALESFYNGAG